MGGAEIQRNGIVGIKGKIDRKEIENDQKCFIKDNSVLVQNLVAHIENPTDHIKITACLPERNDFAIVDTINQITFNENYNAKVFWCLFNSKLINWYAYRFIFAKAIRTMHFDNSITNRIPVPNEINQHLFIEKADLMLSLNKELQKGISSFLRFVKSKFNIETPNKKLQNWHELEFNEFLNKGLQPSMSNKGKLLPATDHNKGLQHSISNKGLQSLVTVISLAEQAQWMEYFNEQKQKIDIIKQQINQTNKEIDSMVYELYELTEEEIKIVENS